MGKKVEEEGKELNRIVVSVYNDLDVDCCKCVVVDGYLYTIRSKSSSLPIVCSFVYLCVQ